MVEFKHCTWTAKKARFGSAVSISIHAWTTVLSENLPIPIFTNTSFLNNTILDKVYSSTNYMVCTNGTGTFLPHVTHSFSMNH